MDSTLGMLSIVLAAGEGKRMHSKRPKVLHEVCGIPMVEHVCNCAKAAGAEEVVVVIGHCADEVKGKLQGVNFVLQETQQGTGHAVLQADSYIDDRLVLVLCGDIPLLRAETLQDMYKEHIKLGNHATVLTAEFKDPFGYGRIVKDASGNIISIVEERDASTEQKLIKEINSGIYLFRGELLKSAIKKIDNNNAQREYYLTDVIRMLNDGDYKVGAYKIDDHNEIMGVNNRYQLTKAEKIMRERILREHMLLGVTIIDPNNTYIDPSVRIEKDVTILPGCIIKGDTYIREDACIGPFSRIIDSDIGKGVEVQNSVVLKSSIGEGTRIGPFAYLRPGNTIGKKVRIGDFVEIKNSTLGDNTKASHLAYIGDGDIGTNVNLGCGVVFVNYDGKEKHRVTIEDGSFVGCNVNLIAPVNLGTNSYIAAGTTVTEDVPGKALAIGRAKQDNKEGWVERKGLLK